MKDGKYLWWHQGQLAPGFVKMQERANPTRWRRIFNAILRRK